MDINDVNLLMEILSSSSSEDELEGLFCVYNKVEVPKIKSFIEQVVDKLSDEGFKKNFRVQRNTAQLLIQQFQSSKFYPSDQSHGGKATISAENHVLSFLWFVANKSSLRDVSQRFGVGTTTLFRQLIRIIDFLLDIAPSIIKFPNLMQEKEVAANKFSLISGFPGVLGCIDGTSINIRTPAHKIKSTYTNRHDLPSITLQAICDHRRRFIHVFTGAPGKIHDARVFKLSNISDTLSTIGNKYHIIGDGAYPIRKWLLTPYKDLGNLTEDKVVYNKKFSATRVLIENAFGILKGRFRQLLQVDLHSVDKITKLIIACCVVHNICIDNNDMLPPEEVLIDDNIEEVLIQQPHTEAELKREGELKRDHIKNSFNYV